MEIICISCWRAFNHDTSSAAAQVTCPHCGFSQPGPDPSSLNAKLDANTRPSQVSSEPTPPAPEEPATTSLDDLTSPELTPPEPDDLTSPELTPPGEQPASPLPKTAEFDAAPGPAAAPQTAVVQPEVAPPEPPKPDHRWRLRTPAMLVLFFPDYEALSRYLTGDEGVGYAVACGPGPFRTLTGFTSAMRVTDDPLEALVNVQPADDEAELPLPTPAPQPRPRGTSRRQSDSEISRPTAQARPEQQGSAPPQDQATPAARPRTRRRRTSATTDFSFRKAQDQNPWPGRIVFLLIGLMAGSAAIYYIAWLGLLPGIVY